MQSTDEKYMKEAIKQAKKAYAIGEVPIGCVIVYQDARGNGLPPHATLVRKDVSNPPPSR